MAIVDTLTKSSFIDNFRKIRPDNFSYDGLESLYCYLEDLSDQIGENIEFDPIGLCCEYSEYKNLDEFNQDYNINATDIDDIRNHTTVIEIPSSESFIIQSF